METIGTGYNPSSYIILAEHFSLKSDPSSSWYGAEVEVFLRILRTQRVHIYYHCGIRSQRAVWNISSIYIYIIYIYMWNFGGTEAQTSLTHCNGSAFSASVQAAARTRHP